MEQSQAQGAPGAEEILLKILPSIFKSGRRREEVTATISQLHAPGAGTLGNPSHTVLPGWESILHLRGHPGHQHPPAPPGDHGSPEGEKDVHWKYIKGLDAFKWSVLH